MKIALPFPRKRRNTSEEPGVRPRKRPSPFRIVLALIILAAVIAGIVYWRMQSSAAPAATTSSTAVVRANLDVVVENSGKVQPARSIDLQFQSEGQVSEVLVKPGDLVRAGQPLARLDDRDLRLGVQQAEADLQTAQAGLAKAKNGSATPEDIAAARARLQASTAALEKTRTGNITAADVRQAEATLRAAQAQLAVLKDPSPDKVSAAQFALTQAQTNLNQTRDTLSEAKTSAELALQRSTSTLTQAQSSYSTAYHNWQHVQDAGTDPLNPTTAGPNGATVDNELNDAQRQQYYDAFVKAEAALRAAENDVKQAQVTYDTARQKEAAGIPEAEAQVANAQRQLDALTNPRPTDLAQAQAAVDQARAQLDKLRQGGTRADVSAAQAQVDEAQAGLEKLTAPVAESDIAIAEASVTQAQAVLDAAKLQLDNATLTAPFDGTVATAGVVPGSVVGAASSPAFTVVDQSQIHLDMKVSESDVAAIKVGQSVNITFDMIPDKQFKGAVTSVATTGEEEQNIVTYLVQAQFDPGTDAVKLGMTANVSIVVERHENVIQVPNRAITSQGAAKTIQVLYGKDNTPVTVVVETGATNGSMTEIVSCLNTGNMCLREGDRVVVDAPAGEEDENGPRIIEGAFPGGAGETIPIGQP